ncbi:hypothetical protein, partial [Raoultella terrigena]|uniref:hypothetical protein n=1 Tax=Raoultella terrigena TaxID=577 RepID=UPI001F461338
TMIGEDPFIYSINKSSGLIKPLMLRYREGLEVRPYLGRCCGSSRPAALKITRLWQSHAIRSRIDAASSALW